jgi:PAS domain S-box-containing protein
VRELLTRAAPEADVSPVTPVDARISLQLGALDGIQLSVIATDAEGTISRWNRGAERLYGWTEEEALGQRIVSLLTTRGLPDVEPVTSLTEAPTGPLPGEYLIQTKSGEIVHVATVTTSVTDAEGSTIGYVGVSHLVDPARSATVTASAAEAWNALSESEGLFRSHFVASLTPQVRCTLDGALMAVNPAFCRLVGYAEHELVGRSVIDLTHPDDREQSHAGFAALRASASEGYEYDKRYVARDGRTIWVHVSSSIALDAAGDPAYAVAIVTDITERRKMERQTVELLRLAEAIEQTAPVGMGYFDLDWRIVRINRILANGGGKSAEAVVGLLLEEAFPQVASEVSPFLERVVETGAAHANLHSIPHRRTGEMRHWMTTYYPVDFKGELAGVGVIAIDVTAIHQAEHFKSVLTETIAEGVYAIDADGRITFINPAAARILGWTVDELLGVHAHDTFHHQHGDGSAFPADECPIARTLRNGTPERVEDDVFTGKEGQLIPVAYSAAPLPQEGGVVVVFRDVSAELTERARARQALDDLSWVGRVRDALDEHRLVLYSQDVTPRRGGVPSEEVLLRMIDPAGRVIAPGSFLPMAERYGLIGEIDRYVISRALELAAARPRRIEINVSATTVADADILRFIEAEIDRTGARPDDLVFEITETALMTDVDAGEAFARGLARLGCRVALDDFGTGYASFTYLKRLPISYLKIDIEFVRGLPQNPANRHVVAAIVSLAQAFGHETIAEGVEDEATLAALDELGVDYAQGFLFSRPSPIEAP